MPTEQKGSAEELARLKSERDEADRRYNDALTRLDDAIQKPRGVPHPPPPYDEFQITPLNERWELLSLKPAEGNGWLRRLRTHAWAMVAPLFERQQAFNSALVDHINRNIAMHRETTRAMEATVAMLREDQQRLIEYQTLLVVYAQQITPYIDTKDRQVAGLMHALAAGLSGLSDEIQKRWESVSARQQRYEAQVSDVQSTLGVMHRVTQTLKRELEKSGLGATGARGARGAGPSGSSRRSGLSRRSDEDTKTTDVAKADGAAEADASGAMGAGTSSLDSYKYVGFEDRFRGSAEEIRERLEAYVPLFLGARDVLDVGCGRGEFLELLKANGVLARGIDLNDEMAAVCRERGLDARAGDALSYLQAQPDGSFGGLFAAQVVEHLEPDYLIRFLETAYHKLRPGSKIVLETINPACWYAFFSSYIRDITHKHPLHPDTLQFLLSASSFQNVSVRYSAPFPEEAKLQSLLQTSGVADETFNENVRRLNSLLFTYLDYAAIGERLS